MKFGKNGRSSPNLIPQKTEAPTCFGRAPVATLGRTKGNTVLVAEHQGTRVEAANAVRGGSYACPQCKGIVIFKPGRRVISHFAHKPPTDCTWARGETRAHLEAKRFVYDAMIGRGRRAELEHVMPGLPGDRRADVMAWSEKGQRLAFELQHASIGLDEIEARANCYARAGIAQFWIPFLSAAVWHSAEPKAGKWFVERYSARPFERWVHGFHGTDGMWMYAPWAKKFWHARLAPHQIWVEQTSWFEAGGEERSAGGFHRWSKRYRELTLSGPHDIEKLRVVVRPRNAASLAVYNWPAGLIGTFAVA